MPEGPEVLLTAQYLQTKSKNRYIKNVKILSGRYTHQKIAGFDLLKGRLQIKKISSKGKFLWMELKNKKGKTIYFLNTFGMSGCWTFNNSDHARLKFILDNGDKNDKTYNLYYHDQRNFGTIVVTDKKSELNKRLDKLGIDLLRCGYSVEEMAHHIDDYIETKKKKNKKQNIVAALMLQDNGKAIGSGIGNYLCAEILYVAEISPHRDITDLKKGEIKKLAIAVRSVIKDAYVNNSTKYMDTHQKFMSTHYKMIKNGKYPNFYPDIKLKNVPFKFKVYGQKKDPKGNPIETDNIFQERTTWWVPKVQK
jgi:formamidopyrimidine-DNA glycosylase